MNHQTEKKNFIWGNVNEFDNRFRLVPISTYLPTFKLAQVKKYF